jgi:hypothetical protein
LAQKSSQRVLVISDEASEFVDVLMTPSSKKGCSGYAKALQLRVRDHCRFHLTPDIKTNAVIHPESCGGSLNLILMCQLGALESATQNDSILARLQNSSVQSRPSVGVEDRLVVISVVWKPPPPSFVVGNAAHRGSSLLQTNVVFGSPEKLQAPSDERAAALASAPQLEFGDDDGGGGGSLSSSSVLLDVYVQKNFTFEDMDRLIRVFSIVVFGKKPGGVQANMCAFGPDSVSAYNQAMSELDDLVNHADKIGDTKLLTKLGRLKTESPFCHWGFRHS